jgi:hypothetical protein
MTVGKIAVLLAFLVLFGTYAYAADCNNGGRYENNLDGTVTDCRTGLIWLQKAKCTDTSNGIDNLGGHLTWDNAMKWVKGLENNLCGLTDNSLAGDWRLPTKTEFMAMITYAKNHSILHPTLTNGAGTSVWTAGDAFTDLQVTGSYWSSTRYASSPDYAWILSPDVGFFSNSTKGGSQYIWPVRGGQSGSFDSLKIE